MRSIVRLEWSWYRSYRVKSFNSVWAFEEGQEEFQGGRDVNVLLKVTTNVFGAMTLVLSATTSIFLPCLCFWCHGSGFRNHDTNLATRLCLWLHGTHRMELFNLIWAFEERQKEFQGLGDANVSMKVSINVFGIMTLVLSATMSILLPCLYFWHHNFGFGSHNTNLPTCSYLWCHDTSSRHHNANLAAFNEFLLF